MPLYKIEEISSSRYMAIWHVEESYEELLQQLTLSKEDHNLLMSFRSEKKKLEWLSGRICLKNLCDHLKMAYHGLRKNANGKPYLKNHTAEISLTHSYPYVAAIMDADTDVGIDLEQPKEKLKRIAYKFLSDAEMEEAGSDINWLCIYWCAKETLYKICDQHISFREQMAIEIINRGSSGQLVGKVIVNGSIKSYKLDYRIEKDYILTYNV